MERTGIGELSKKQGCTLNNADGNADVNVVLIVVSCSECVHTSVIGKDIDY